MDHSSPSTAQIDAASVARAVRFVTALLVLGMSIPNINGALGISTMRIVAEEMLGNDHLPWFTPLVLQSHSIFVAISIAIPVLALILLFIKSVIRAIYALGVVLFILFLQLFFMVHAFEAVLVQVVTRASPF
jgi:hypothetical protein